VTIVRHKHKGNFTTVPNEILEDPRLCLGAKGLLCFMISRPPGWRFRNTHLQRAQKVGAKALANYVGQLERAGYLDRDSKQGRDENNKFTLLNYVVRDVSRCPYEQVETPLRRQPYRKRSNGNNIEEVKTDLNKSYSKALSTVADKRDRAGQVKYSDVGERALAAGNKPVYVGSKPYDAWREYRGDVDGSPEFVDIVLENGRRREIVWRPSVFPPGYRVGKTS
jgi:hypothetical protein